MNLILILLSQWWGIQPNFICMERKGCVVIATCGRIIHPSKLERKYLYIYIRKRDLIAMKMDKTSFFSKDERKFE